MSLSLSLSLVSKYFVPSLSLCGLCIVCSIIGVQREILLPVLAGSPLPIIAAAAIVFNYCDILCGTCTIFYAVLSALVTIIIIYKFYNAVATTNKILETIIADTTTAGHETTTTIISIIMRRLCGACGYFISLSALAGLLTM